MESKANFFSRLDKLATKITVSEIMVKKIMTIYETDTVKRAIDMMSKHSISGLIVCGPDESPIGMLSEGDIIKRVLHLSKDPDKVKISSIMSRELMTIGPDTSLSQAGRIMKSKKISKLPIVQDGKMIGYITKSDLFERLNDIYIQNKRLMWVIIVILIQFIVIAVLLMAYINK